MKGMNDEGIPVTILSGIQDLLLFPSSSAAHVKTLDAAVGLVSKPVSNSRH